MIKTFKIKQLQKWSKSSDFDLKDPQRTEINLHKRTNFIHTRLDHIAPGHSTLIIQTNSNEYHEIIFKDDMPLTAESAESIVIAAYLNKIITRGLLVEGLQKSECLLLVKDKPKLGIQRPDGQSIYNDNDAVMAGLKTPNFPMFSESVTWSHEVYELAEYFTRIELSTQPIKLNQGITITNLPLFIKSHLATIKANKGNDYFLPYLHRLGELKQFIELNNKIQ